MGLFKKKNKIPDGIRVMFYDGGLNGFTTNYPCQLLLQQDSLRITKINPDVTVNLDRSRIISMEIILNEKDYMEKYKGHEVQPLKKDQISKSYFVIKYTDKDETVQHLDFWCTAFDISKLRKMEEEFSTTLGARSYDI